MAYFARVENGEVVRFHVVADAVLINELGEFDASLGQQLLEDLHGIPASSWVLDEKTFATVEEVVDETTEALA
jgi:hypothetical protein